MPWQLNSYCCITCNLAASCLGNLKLGLPSHNLSTACPRRHQASLVNPPVSRPSSPINQVLTCFSGWNDFILVARNISCKAKSRLISNWKVSSSSSFPISLIASAKVSGCLYSKRVRWQRNELQLAIYVVYFFLLGTKGANLIIHGQAYLITVNAPPLVVWSNRLSAMTEWSTSWSVCSTSPLRDSSITSSWSVIDSSADASGDYE